MLISHERSGFSRRKSITCIGIGLRLNQKVLKTITCIAEAKVSQLSDLSHLHRVVVATSHVGARLTLSLASRIVTIWANSPRTSTRASPWRGSRSFSRTTRCSSRTRRTSPTTCAATPSRWRGPARRFVAGSTSLSSITAWNYARCKTRVFLINPPCPTRAEGVRIACDRVREAFLLAGHRPASLLPPNSKKRCVPMTGKQQCERVPGGCVRA